MTTRGQEMSENTLLSFLISPKFSFLRFAEKLSVSCWTNDPHSEYAHSRGFLSYPGKGYFQKLQPSEATHFWEKPTFFYTKFQKLFSLANQWSVDQYFFDTIRYNQTESFSVEVFFLFISLFSLIRLATESKSANNYFSSKKGSFSRNFETSVIMTEFSSKIPIRKSNWNIRKIFDK